MSQLIPTLRTGGDVLIVRKSRPEAALITFSKYNQLHKLDVADERASYLLALGRYFAEHRSAQTLAEVMDRCDCAGILTAFAPATALRVVDSAAAEVLSAERHEQTMLMVAMREIAENPGTGVTIGPPETSDVRVVRLGQWHLVFATAPDWDVPYVLEVTREGSRDCVDRMNEAARLMGATLSRYSVFHKPAGDDPTGLADAEQLHAARGGAVSPLRPRARAKWDDAGDGGI